MGIYIYRGSGTFEHIDFEGPFTDSPGSGVYALGSDNTDLSHCDFDLATSANNGTYNKYSTSIDVTYSNMDVPGANHYYMKEISSGPSSTISYSYLGCNPDEVDSNDFYGDISWAYISSYPISNAGASWKKSVGSGYWLVRELMRSKDYKGAYDLCMDLFNDNKTENRSDFLQLAMQAAKKMHTFSEEKAFLKTCIKDKDIQVREAAKVWLSILYGHTKEFEHAQTMIENTTLTGENKLSMLFNLAAAYDDADYDDKALVIFQQMIEEFPEEKQEVLEFIREMYHASNSPKGRLDKPVKQFAVPEQGIHAYPNPFNASTSIVYHVPTKEYVQIQIYDIRGRKVKTLVDKTVEQGQHVVKWNGTNNLGSLVSTGVYFYHVRFKDQAITKKLLLLQ